jgi:hypothetical protein
VLPDAGPRHGSPPNTRPLACRDGAHRSAPPPPVTSKSQISQRKNRDGCAVPPMEGQGLALLAANDEQGHRSVFDMNAPTAPACDTGHLLAAEPTCCRGSRPAANLGRRAGRAAGRVTRAGQDFSGRGNSPDPRQSARTRGVGLSGRGWSLAPHGFAPVPTTGVIRDGEHGRNPHLRSLLGDDRAEHVDSGGRPGRADRGEYAGQAGEDDVEQDLRHWDRDGLDAFVLEGLGQGDPEADP